jgi:hypothetical protein
MNTTTPLHRLWPPLPAALCAVLLSAGLAVLPGCSTGQRLAGPDDAPPLVPDALLPAREEVLARRQPPEPFDDWSGAWVGREAALLWLRHSPDGALAGRYDPPGDRARPVRFAGGRVQGSTAAFDLTLKGKRWHCQLQRDGERLAMTGRPDLAGLLADYDSADRMPGGGLLIEPARPGQRQEMARRRQEIIEKATQMTDFGNFVRNPDLSAEMKGLQP